MKLPILLALLCSSALIAQAQIFQQTYGTAKSDIGLAVAESPTGEFYLVGRNSVVGSLDNSQTQVIKTDAAGNEIWSKAFGGPLRSSGSDVAVAFNGDVVVCGSTNWLTNDTLVLLRLDTDGNEIWQKRFSDAQSITATAFKQTADSGFAIIARQGPILDENFLLIKTDSDGNLLWQKQHGSPGDDTPSDIHLTSDGGYFLSGISDNFGTGSFEFYLLRLDVNGDTVWTQTYSSSDVSVCLSGFPTSDGGYVMSGYCGDLSDSTGYNLCVVKVDANGNEEWNTLHNSSIGTQGFGKSIVQTPDDGFLIAGSIETASGKQLYTVGLDQFGSVVSEQLFPEGSSSEGNEIIAVSDGSFAIVGSTFDNIDSNHFQVYFVKLFADTLSSAIDEVHQLQALAYPNPFSSFTVIQLPETRNASVLLQDITGKLVSQSEPSVGSSFLIDRANLAKGAYIYSLMENGQVIARGKLVAH